MGIAEPWGAGRRKKGPVGPLPLAVSALAAQLIPSTGGAGEQRLPGHLGPPRQAGECCVQASGKEPAGAVGFPCA